MKSRDCSQRRTRRLLLQDFGKMVLPNGIPSDDTFRRVFEKLDPKILEQKLRTWINQLIGSISQEVIPIDGKSLRGSYDRQKGVKNLHLVTAWASEHRLVLGQVKVEDHSNEITAIPALLELIDITGAIITIDAMGTQTQGKSISIRLDTRDEKNLKSCQEKPN